MLLNRIVTQTVVSASREIAAPADKIFELIADPSQQPRWDGNDNLAEADAGQRVQAAGDVFTMVLTMGVLRDNHVAEFDEGRLIAWRPSEQGKETARSPVAMAARTRRRLTHAGHPHLRLVPADRQESPATRACHHC
jgi:uncharacterized protein YndB with AHSA1/START domain